MTQAKGRKSILVTGAASGIGAETARLFVKRGWFVGAFDIDEPGLSDLADVLGSDNCITGRLDVRDREDWARSVEAFLASTDGRLHVLFNNAGIARTNWFEDIAPQDHDAIIDVNLKGVIHGIEACLPALKNTQGARIVNTASVTAIAAMPRLAVYAATKHAVHGLTDALDLEFSSLGIRVLSLMPWFIDTNILNDASNDGSNRPGKTQLTEAGVDVYPASLAAETVWQAVHGKKTHYMVGKAAEQARFFSRFFPGIVRKRMASSMPPRED
ncbi:MAG: SDR family oxidoreductase [Pseudomonadota bacterium]